jgi:ATP-binding cassette, subfamily B, bacterial MsbA
VRIFPQFDPRLAAELRTQKSPIIKGLLCVLVTSALTAGSLSLVKGAVSAIQEAAPLSRNLEERRRVRHDELISRANKLAPLIGRSVAEVEGAIDRIQVRETDEEDSTLARLLAGELREPETKIREALRNAGGKPQGNRDAVFRLGYFSLLVVLVYGLKYWFTRGQQLFLSQASADLTARLRKQLFSKLQRLPVSYFGEKRAGSIQSVLTNDIGVYQNAVSIIRDSIDGPTKAVFALGYVLYNSWQLALVTLLFLPPMALVIHSNGKRIKKSQADVQHDLGELNAMTAESLMGARIIKAFAVEDKVNRDYAGLVDLTFRSQMTAARRFASLRPLVELIGAVALASVLYICGWLSFRGELQLGQIAALLLALDTINQGLRSISSVSGTYNQVQAASERIYREVLDVPDQVEKDEGVTFPDPRGRIEFQNVSFSYPDGTEALRNISFTLEPSSSLALVGPSGAGKSTIADLLLRFYDPTSGRILFDGVDLRELNVLWLRRQIGVVPQQTFLFAGTIAENIRMGSLEASESDVAIAARQGHVDEFVRELPDGYETVIGEGGNGLSGGQKQRVAIARALVRRPALLLLDEATSALDATSEKAVTEALDEVMQERTTLFIAHRLTTAARADRILVLRRGEIVEEGSHASLMEASGVYAGLFRAFSGGVLD